MTISMTTRAVIPIAKLLLSVGIVVVTSAITSVFSSLKNCKNLCIINYHIYVSQQGVKGGYSLMTQCRIILCTSKPTQNITLWYLINRTKIKFDIKPGSSMGRHSVLAMCIGCNPQKQWWTVFLQKSNNSIVKRYWSCPNNKNEQITIAITAMAWIVIQDDYVRCTCCLSFAESFSTGLYDL